MLKNKNIICISSIDWDFNWQGHQEIMSSLARNGNRVLFIENTGVRLPSLRDISRLKKRFLDWKKSLKGFRMASDNLYVYSPLFLPFPYSRLAGIINIHLIVGPLRRWMKSMDFHEPIIWTFLPTRTALQVIDGVPDKELLIYYCIADFEELVKNPKKVRRSEKRLIRISDIIFAQGRTLEEKCKKLNNNVFIFPFGVNIEAFEAFKGEFQKSVPSDLKEIKPPIIGYVGGIHRHVDFSLIREVATSHREWSLVFVGPIQTDIDLIKDMPNVFFIGEKEFSALPAYINCFDVGIIPYQRSGFTNTVYPTKLNEYHILGKPVVSTNLPEVMNFNRENMNLVAIADDPVEFAQKIKSAISNTNTELIQARINSAENNSWRLRIEKMNSIIGEFIEKKREIAQAEWQENLLVLYRTARKKLLQSFSVGLLLYLLFFNSPFIWFAASPLKISSHPENSDCIVVFAGGVGESGKAGQGYEERVQYAVELYRKGFAKHIIFSSGYTYAFKEPLVMEALAISLGVPAGSIILEDNAKNTYENVVFTNRILRANNWSKILLISSPYHMRRAVWVFNRVAQGIKVIPTPIPRSLFYQHRTQGGMIRQIDLQQIKGILHEYIGIIYYYLKRYI